MTLGSTVHGKVAFEFASHLVEGDFSKAHNLITLANRTEWSESKLKERYEEMIAYGDGPADSVEITATLDDWELPPKRPDDIGWAYAAIIGPSYTEAVTVIVCLEDGVPRIRYIEWGRP